MNTTAKAWDKVRGDEPEYERLSPDARERLRLAESEVRQGRSSGIAGLEEFEAELNKAPEVKQAAAASAGQGPQVRSSDRLSVTETDGAKQTAKGSGAQEPQTPERALESAAAAGERVEADETHSPSFPSAARPLAAEAPGNAPTPDESGAAKKSGSKAAAKSGAKKAASKTAARSTARKGADANVEVERERARTAPRAAASAAKSGAKKSGSAKK